jgi:hypothetical protein
MTPPPLMPGTPVWRLTLSFDVRSIIVLRATLTHRGMRRRATGQQTRLAERTGQKTGPNANSPIFACRVFTSMTGSA